jgi:hypothetical protein
MSEGDDMTDTQHRTDQEQWTWKQPKDGQELLSRLADARDLDVPERERENLCGCAYTALRQQACELTTVKAEARETIARLGADADALRVAWRSAMARADADEKDLTEVHVLRGALMIEQATVKAENERLRDALMEIATGRGVWERDEMIDCAVAALKTGEQG